MPSNKTIETKNAIADQMDDTIDNKSDHLVTNKCLNDEELCQTDDQLMDSARLVVVDSGCDDTSGQTMTIDGQLVSEGHESAAKGETPEPMPYCSGGGAAKEPVLTYQLKWINWGSVKTPIITQNLNGPCPLLAIINVLILKRKIQLPSMMDVITDDQLMEYLGDCIISSVPKNIPEGVQLNYEQNFMDAMQILPKLPKGLDVN
ncbi:unnamed protein product, partial [Medioppia subpectinata]